MRRTLGPADNAILEEYMTNIRDVERQIARMESRAAATPEGAVAPLGLPDNIDDHLTVTYDLMLLAFQADISRVFTFMVAHEGSGRSYPHIGIPEPHHPVSHHGDTPEGIAKYAKLTTYHVSKLAEFVGKLQATSDGDGTLLDRSLIYFGSGMGNGNAHDRNNPPVLLMGGRQRPSQGRPPHRRRRQAADGQPASRDGGTGERRGRADRAQHRTPQPVGEALSDIHQALNP